MSLDRQQRMMIEVVVAISIVMGGGVAVIAHERTPASACTEWR